MATFSEVSERLFPKKNRAVAWVAGIRTFEQTIKSALTIGAGGGIIVTATDVLTINWAMLGWTVLALVLTALVAGYIAFSDVARHGINSSYAEALATQPPPAEVEARDPNAV